MKYSPRKSEQEEALAKIATVHLSSTVRTKVAHRKYKPKSEKRKQQQQHPSVLASKPLDAGSLAQWAKGKRSTGRRKTNNLKAN